MKFKNLYIIAIAAIFASCSNDDTQGTQSDSNKIMFVSGVDKLLTRTSQDGSKWNVDDKIGVYMIDNAGATNLKKNMPYAAISASQSSSFKAVGEGIVFPSSDLPVAFISYYPYSKTVANMKYEVFLADQSTGLESHDLMYAKSDNEGKGFVSGAVPLAFKHQLSKLNLTLVDEKGDTLTADGGSIYIKGMDTQATFDLEKGALGEPSNQVNIIPYSNNTTYEAIIIPTTIKTGYELELQINGSHYIWSMNAKYNDFEFKSGYVYTFKITVKTSSAEIEAELVDVNDSSINPWGNGGDDNKKEDVEPVPDYDIPTDYEKITVPNGSLIQSALSKATRAKVAIVLDNGGSYSEGSFTIPASITSLLLVGEGGLVPPSFYIGGSLKIGGNLDLFHVYNINISGTSTGYFINQNIEVVIDKMIIDQSLIHDLRGIVRLQTSASKINNYVIDNSILYNIGDYNILTVDAGAVYNIELRRSTCNNLSGRGFNLSKMTEAATVSVTECTFNKGPLYAISQFAKDTGATINFINNIVGMPYNTTRGVSVYSNATTVTESNNYYVANTVWLDNSPVGVDCNLSDTDLWTNPDEGNFKQTSLKVGDPRWY